jgi:predicted DNA-binding WGR domain protein
MTVASYKLEARNPALNLNRYYEIDVTRDLFGDWVIMTYYGRIRYNGQRKQYGYPSFNDMIKKLFEILRKRFHAQTRIGCNYALVSSHSHKDFSIFKTLVQEAPLARMKKSHNKHIECIF